MARIEVGSNLCYIVQSPSTFLLNISVAKNEHQLTANESIEIHPYHRVEECKVGSLGNRILRLNVQPGNLQIQYRATVDMNAETVDVDTVEEVSFEKLPAEVFQYLNPSRYCESDKLFRFATEEFGDLIPGYSRVTAICNWVFEQLSYTPGSTGPSTTACDVLLQRTGVCRDYAHVAISLCRAIGIPTRYVSGYAANLQPPDFHGFFEAFLDGRWFLFDATRLAPVGGFVRIGTGRDAADVAFATIRGFANSSSVEVFANETNPSDELLDPTNVTTGVSIS